LFVFAILLQAREWHPDKNPGNRDEAADKFREIVEAFETLSDNRTKRQYDQRSAQTRRHQELNEERRRQAAQKKQQQEREVAAKKKLFFDNAKLLQSKIIRVSSLEELKATALDKNGRLRRNLLMVFLADKKVEKFVDEELLFPYLPSVEGKDFEDIILAVKVRYNSDTELTRYCKVPTHETAGSTGNAFIVAGSKGDDPTQLKTFSARMGGDSHGAFSTWAANILSVRVEMLNHHHSDVQLFKKSAEHGIEGIFVVKPGWGQRFSVRLGDEIWAMDTNVDNWPGRTPKLDTVLLTATKDKVLLGTWKVLEHQTIEVLSKNCVDMSTFCDTWIKHAKINCEDKPEFMHSICARSCGVCLESSWSSLYYSIFHEPVTRWPRPLHRFLTFLRVFVNDMSHVLGFRKNAAASAFACGVMLGLTVYDGLFHKSLLGFLFRQLLLAILGVTSFVVVISDDALFEDMLHLLEVRRNVVAVLVVLGIIATLSIALTMHPWRRRDTDRNRNQKAKLD
jgi:hypothetical protein